MSLSRRIKGDRGEIICSLSFAPSRFIIPPLPFLPYPPPFVKEGRGGFYLTFFLCPFPNL